MKVAVGHVHGVPRLVGRRHRPDRPKRLGDSPTRRQPERDWPASRNECCRFPRSACEHWAAQLV